MPGAVEDTAVSFRLRCIVLWVHALWTTGCLFISGCSGVHVQIPQLWQAETTLKLQCRSFFIVVALIASGLWAQLGRKTLAGKNLLWIGIKPSPHINGESSTTEILAHERLYIVSPLTGRLHRMVFLCTLVAETGGINRLKHTNFTCLLSARAQATPLRPDQCQVMKCCYQAAMVRHASDRQVRHRLQYAGGLGFQSEDPPGE